MLFILSSISLLIILWAMHAQLIWVFQVLPSCWGAWKVKALFRVEQHLSWYNIFLNILLFFWQFVDFFWNITALLIELLPLLRRSKALSRVRAFLREIEITLFFYWKYLWDYNLLLLLIWDLSCTGTIKLFWGIRYLLNRQVLIMIVLLLLLK